MGSEECPVIHVQIAQMMKMLADESSYGLLYLGM